MKPITFFGGGGIIVNTDLLIVSKQFFNGEIWK